MRLSAFLTLTKTAPKQFSKTDPDPVSKLKGESQDQLFTDRIEVLSYDYRFHSNFDADDGAALAVPGDLYVIKPIDITSPILFQLAASTKAKQKEEFTHAVLSVCRYGVDENSKHKTEIYWRIKLTNPLVTSIAQVGDPALHPLDRGVLSHLATAAYGPLEQVTFSADQIDFEYEPESAAVKKAAAVKIQAAARGMLGRHRAAAAAQQEQARWARMAEEGLFGSLGGD